MKEPHDQPGEAEPDHAIVSGAVLPPRHWRLFIATALIGTAADQAGKSWAASRFPHASGQRIALGLLRFELSRNSGAAFGIGRGLTPWITALSLTVIFGVCYAGLRARSRAWALALGLIAAGAAGNAVDRLTRAPGPGRGAVVDWIKVPFYGPVFNLADLALRAGALFALIIVMHDWSRKRRTGD
jgi:signal peptidase II